MKLALVRDSARSRWLRFREARGIIQAFRPAEVLPAIRELERRVDAEGLYAAGFIGYEAAPGFDPALGVRPAAAGPDSLPLLSFGLFGPPEELAALPEPAGPVDAPRRWEPSMTRAGYVRALGVVRERIARGDTYQVNFTLRLRAEFDGDPWSWFLQLQRAQSAGHAAYLDMDRYVAMSASPELFFQLDGERIVARPMKGTAARAPAAELDLVAGRELAASAKNRAENVMIADMMRNDLGRIARVGSVRAPRLFDLERYPTVWQLTSTVEAETTAPLSGILAATFPAASVTGAPKPATMAIIAALETTPRRLYTGAIGFVAPGRRAEFNVAIRTVLLDREPGAAEYGVGGGIVWDSEPDAEYEECRVKARVLETRRPRFEILETLRWDPGCGFRLPDLHLRRLVESADYFSFPAEESALRAELLGAAAPLADRPHRVRLLLSESGAVRVESSPEASPFDEGPAPEPSAPAPARPVRLALAASPVCSDDPFLHHKTTWRDTYARRLAERPGAEDVLLWNERRELTETTIANLVVRLEGELFTPPVRCGLLPGTYRARLLADGRIKERVLPLDALGAATEIWLVNSVRGWRRAELVEIGATAGEASGVLGM